MCSEPVAIRASGLGKCYQIYNSPRDRLKQFIYPPLRSLIRLAPRNYFQEFWALRDISVEVQQGESVALIGRNGCGKSTLLQILAGTLTPTTGTVSTSGRIAALLELGSGFNQDFSGRENVFMNAAILGLSQSDIQSRFEEIAAFAGIGEFMDQPLKTYSSGMVVRLAFAVSVCVDPDILIIDEALSVGDAAFQFKCLDRLKTLLAKGTTLLFVSHDMSMVKNFCDRAIYLKDGITRAQGSPDEMAELYFMDIRDEQRKSIDPQQGVIQKTFVGTGKGIAFGTEEGEIVSAAFDENGSQFVQCAWADDLFVRVTARFRKSVIHPSLSIIVQNQRMVELGGGFFPLHGITQGSEWLEGTLRIRLPVRLFAGRYFISLRLETRRGDQTLLPIDKQVGALSFEVVDLRRQFIGPVDLGLECLEP